MTPLPNQPPKPMQRGPVLPGSRHVRPKRRTGWILWTLLLLAVMVAAAVLIGWRLRYQQEWRETETKVAALLQSADSLIVDDRQDEAEAAAREALGLRPDEPRCREMLARITTQREMVREKNASAAAVALEQAEKLASGNIAAAIEAFGKIHLERSFPPEARQAASERAKVLKGGVCTLRLPDDWPLNAELWIDDVTRDCEKNLIRGIAAGKRTVRTTRYGFRDPAAMELEFRGLDPLPLPTIQWHRLGTKVSVTSKPPGAAVWRNGKNSGKITPCFFEDVDDGPLDLVLKLRAYADTPVKGVVADRKPLKLFGALLELPHLPVDGKTAGERYEINLTPDFRVPFRWCPAGRFKMGGSAANEHPTREVTLTKGFWMAETEFTQAQWKAIADEFAEVLFVLEGKGKPRPAVGPNHPMALATWEKICGDESRQGGILGQINTYLKANKNPWIADLPTEAQWEYACRAGTTGAFGSRSADPKVAESLAWHATNSGGTAHEIGTRQANPWGLHDMHGNVYEWCRDSFQQTYQKLAATDPTGPALSGWSRTIRGGCFNSQANDCRCASRMGADGFKPQAAIGFRLVLHPPEPVVKSAPSPPKKANPKAKPKPKPKPKPQTKAKPKPKKKAGR